MIIKRMACQYFLNFGSYSEINFEEEQKIISIVGSWHNQSKSSNRSGKSSFLEMIVYVLYGKTRAKKEIDLINKKHSEKDMFVEIEFDNGVIVKRGRTSGNDIILEMTDFEGADKKVIQEEIIRIIGMNYEDFIMTSFFLQGDIHTFMESGATSQKQIMSKWLEKDYWKIFEKNAKSKMDDINKEIIKLQVVADLKPDASKELEIKDNIILLKPKMEALEESLKVLQIELEGVTEQLKLVDKIDELNKQIISNKNDIKNTEDIIFDYDEKDSELKIKLKEAAKNVKRLLELNGIDEKLLKDKKDILNQYVIEYKVKVSELSDLKSELRQLKSNFENMDKFNAICPVTKMQCQSLDSIDSSKAELRKSGIVVAAKIKKLELVMKESEDKSEKLEEEIEEIRQLLNEIKLLNKNADVEEISKQLVKNTENIINQKDILSKKESALKVLEKELLKLNKIDFEGLKAKKIKINNEISVNKASISDIINIEAKLNAELEVMKKQKVESIKAEKEIKENNRLFNIYKYISFMFGKNGIPFTQIETAFNEIEEEANLILQGINSDIYIEFAPDKELGQWESNCLVCGTVFPKGYRKTECPECESERQKKRKDELNIIIHTDGGEMDFCSESGGGKVLISLAIRLAFVRLLQRRNGVNLKIIALDEIFGMLDSVNRDYVLKMLSTTLINEFDFSQIFVISHEEELRDVIPDVIQITRYPDHSEYHWK